MKSSETPRRPFRALALLTVVLAFVAVTLAPTGASAGYEKGNPAPKAQIQQDGPMVEVVIPRGQNRGIDRIEFRLTDLGTGEVIEGDTNPPQIKLVLAFDERYQFSFRALRHGTWTDWSAPVPLTAPTIDAYPFAIQAEGIDHGIALRWADTSADAYRIIVRNRWGKVAAKETVSGTETTITGLDNGHTYKVQIRSIYGKRKTTKSPAIPVTPNNGAGVTVELRDYTTDPLSGPTDLTVRTAIGGATERIAKVRVQVIPEGLKKRTRTATFDPAASATTGIDGAFVTPALSISPFDHNLITIVKGEKVDGKRIVLASSMQTWLMGNVDAFAPGASEFTRVGTIR